MYGVRSDWTCKCHAHVVPITVSSTSQLRPVMANTKSSNTLHLSIPGCRFHCYALVQRCQFRAEAALGMRKWVSEWVEFNAPPDTIYRRSFWRLRHAKVICTLNRKLKFELIITRVSRNGHQLTIMFLQTKLWDKESRHKDYSTTETNDAPRILH